MINAAQLAKDIQAGHRARINNSILIFGAPKTGKTRMVASVAEMPSIKRVVWFDTERGIDTLLSGQAGISQEGLAKIEPILFRDTKDVPRVAETLLKALTSPSTVHIDQETGKLLPHSTDQSISFAYHSLDASTAVVFDTISQAADSVFNLQLLLYKYKDNRKYWGEFYGDMNAILSSIQSSSAINILTAQEQIKEGTTQEEGKRRTVLKATDSAKTSAVMVQDDKLIPVCGSYAYSMKVAKYVGSLIRLYVERSSYKGVSQPTTIANVLAGSRIGVDISSIANPTISDILGVTRER